MFHLAKGRVGQDAISPLKRCVTGEAGTPSYLVLPAHLSSPREAVNFVDHRARRLSRGRGRRGL